MRALAIFVTTMSMTSTLDAQPSSTDPAARFERGVRHAQAGRYDAALTEFERAYEASPAYQVLYNIGKLHVALRRPVEATRTLRRYLAEGGDSVPEPRRLEVEELIAEQASMIAEVRIQATVSGADVLLDGIDTEHQTPTTLELAAGEHLLAVRAPGYETSQQRIRLAGGDEREVHFELRPIAQDAAVVTVQTNVSDVSVTIDGRAHGTTEEHTSFAVEAGRHVIVGQRPGYIDSEVSRELTAGTEENITLTMRHDPQAPADALGNLELLLPDASFVARIDDELVQERWLEVPIGRHRIQLDMAERMRFEETFVIEPGETFTLRPQLHWTPDARQSRMNAARRRRRAGWSTFVTGVVMTAAGTGVLVWNEGRANELEPRRAMFDFCTAGSTPAEELPAECSPDAGYDYLGERAAISDLDRSIRAMRGTSYGLIAVGAATTIAGVVIAASASSERAIDEQASAPQPELSFGPREARIGIRGRF